MTNTQKLSQVLARREAILQGDAAKVGKQKADGKLTARERIAMLLDAGSFVELDALLSRNGDYSGVVTGSGTVNDRPVYVFAQDFTVHGGAMGEMQAQKICKLLDIAAKNPAPVIALCDSAGVRVDEGARAMNAYARIYAKLSKLSSPVLALILGPAIGGAALMAQIADLAIQAENVGQLMVYGPTVVSAMTGRALSAKDVGGAKVMAEQGAVALTAPDEDAAIALAVRVLDYLPDDFDGGCELTDTDDLNRLLPETDADDAAALLQGMADNGEALELYAAFGKEIRTALARVGGYVCGLVVSDARVNDGELAPDAARKAARLIDLCDYYGLPVISLINSRGIQVPDEHSQAGTIRAVAELLSAYTEADVPKVSVIVGNAIGQAYVAMAGKENADVTYAWPGAVISALTPEAAVQVLCGKELREGAGDPLADRQALTEKFADEVADAVSAASDGMIDDVIEPAQTRKYVIAALEMLGRKEG
ncbi:MAG: hypothetical protein IJK28_06085 [Clostridia bacterium]|nr:hypothetical protein [Clostridia bacterium]